MSNLDVHIEAARAAVECAGELVTYAEDGVAVGDIWAKITRDTEILDGSGVPMRTTVIRLVKPDVPGLTRKASFETAAAVLYKFKNVVSDNGVTIVVKVGK